MQAHPQQTDDVPGPLGPAAAMGSPVPDSPPHAAGLAVEPAQVDAKLAPWLKLLLDHIDQGLLLVLPDATVLYGNAAALRELDAAHPLRCDNHRLRLHHAQDVAPLHDALADAARGQRRLLRLGLGRHSLNISVVPLSGPERPDALEQHPGILLVLGRCQVDSTPQLQQFAQSLALTPTETRVLGGLCAGLRPAELSRQMAVAVSTIRTHISSMRAKTGASSIRDLVYRVSVQPPVKLSPPPTGGSAADDRRPDKPATRRKR